MVARPFQRYASRRGGAAGGRRLPPSSELFGGRRARATPATGRDALSPYVSSYRGSLGDFTGDLPYGVARNYGSPQVEAWRDLVEELAGDLPVEFLLAWIGWESGGDPCSWTSYQEAGIFQLMPPDNLTQGGTTMAMMHPVPPCGASSGSPRSSRSALPDDVAREQVRAGVQYVNYCRNYVRGKLSTYGYTWDESDYGFWALVKMVHALPSVVGKMLQAGIDGSGGDHPADWETIKRYAFAQGVVNTTLTTNAESVGQYGAGGGSVLDSLGGSSGMLGIAALTFGLWYLWKRVK